MMLVVNKAPANFVHPNTGAVLAVFPETGVYFVYVSNSAYVSSLALPAKSAIVPIPQEYVEGLEEVASDATAAKTAAESIDMHGKTWTQSNVTDGSFGSIVYANGLWVAGSNNGLYYSASKYALTDTVNAQLIVDIYEIIH